MGDNIILNTTMTAVPATMAAPAIVQVTIPAITKGKCKTPLHASGVLSG